LRTYSDHSNWSQVICISILDFEYDIIIRWYVLKDLQIGKNCCFHLNCLITHKICFDLYIYHHWIWTLCLPHFLSFILFLLLLLQFILFLLFFSTFNFPYLFLHIYNFIEMISQYFINCSSFFIFIKIVLNYFIFA
jgi:hypothetical protein